MKTLEGILSKHPFFEGLDPRYIELAVGCAANVRFDAGDIIFREGERSSAKGRTLNQSRLVVSDDVIADHWCVHAAIFPRPA